jgi:hypothetical protein
VKLLQHIAAGLIGLLIAFLMPRIFLAFFAAVGLFFLIFEYGDFD